MIGQDKTIMTHISCLFSIYADSETHISLCISAIILSFYILYGFLPVNCFLTCGTV